MIKSPTQVAWSRVHTSIWNAVPRITYLQILPAVVYQAEGSLWVFISNRPTKRPSPWASSLLSHAPNISPSHCRGAGNSRLAPEQSSKVVGQTWHDIASAHGLVFLDRRVRFLNACRRQVGLDCILLVGMQVHVRDEVFISRQSDLDLMLSGRDQHGATESAELVNVSHEGIVNEHSGALGSNVQFHFCITG